MHELTQPHQLGEAEIERYRNQGFVKLARVLSAQTIADYEAEVTRVVRDLDEAQLLEQYTADYGAEFAGRVARVFSGRTLDAASTYARAFTQRPNLWRFSKRIEAFVRSPRLARIAAELMGVAGVRIYHDQALFKEAFGGHTPWHVDQFYWPLSNDRTVTAWIPLQAVSMAMGPVAFARGSHESGVRDLASQLAISDESEQQLTELMADFEVDETPFVVGDVSFHAGWTCHRAGANQTAQTRAAFTIIYMDRDIRLIEPAHINHRMDANMWLPGVEVGDVAASILNPIVYQQ
jgi:ectoine hydroxylase-related dioxygenase (phytanoyl-CoA dioxygenase family)